ncbi:hypothetical protein BD408DRAFT_146987 [Parasitella parasitica]|nr:hypothetical protein BD408DRAFT_146987 [Parasitella parasitica]
MRNSTAYLPNKIKLLKHIPLVFAFLPCWFDDRWAWGGILRTFGMAVWRASDPNTLICFDMHFQIVKHLFHGLSKRLEQLFSVLVGTPLQVGMPMRPLYHHIIVVSLDGDERGFVQFLTVLIMMYLNRGIACTHGKLLPTPIWYPSPSFGLIRLKSSSFTR